MTYVRIRRKPPGEHKPAGRRARAPWDSAASRNAGLPAERVAWLAQVLPALAAAPSMNAAAGALGVFGAQLRHWHAALVRLHAAGELAEAGDAVPMPGTAPAPPAPAPPKPRRGRPPKPRG